MGTDIHLFVEYCKPDSPPWAQQDNIVALNEGELFIHRNYNLFDALASGRSFNISSPPERTCLFPPRGLPIPVSNAIERRYYEWVTDGSTIPRGFAGSLHVPMHFISRNLAEELKLTIQKVEVDVYGRELESFERVVNPDWHSVSWLYVDEVDASLEHFKLDLEKLHVTTQIFFRMVRDMEKSLGHRRVRLVFWFDN